jgi:copper chaperone
MRYLLTMGQWRKSEPSHHGRVKPWPALTLAEFRDCTPPVDFATVGRFRLAFLGAGQTIAQRSCSFKFFNPQGNTMEFNVPDMSCGHCAGVITKALQQLDADAMISIDLSAKKVTVETAQDRQTVADALLEAGYPTH